MSYNQSLQREAMFDVLVVRRSDVTKVNNSRHNRYLKNDVPTGRAHQVIPGEQVMKFTRFHAMGSNPVT